jgi:tetratricopeptide (TPR) repeat protein
VQIYLTFVLQFGAFDGESYSITATGPGGDATGHLASPSEYPGLQALLDRLARFETDEQLLTELGQLLFRAIFQDDVRDVYIRSQGLLAEQQGLRLLLIIPPAEVAIAALPWEFLHDPDRGPLALLDMPIMRYVPQSARLPSLAADLPLRLLLTGAHTPPAIDIERELREVQAALAGLGQRIEVTVEPHLTVGLLQRYLRDEYHIWHFIGHGGYDRDGTTGRLAFEDERGDTNYVSAAQLGVLLDRSSIRIAILDACEGARVATDPFRSVALALVRAQIPAVLAMQLPIPEESTRAFAAEFYRALAEGLAIDACVTEGRKAVMNTNGLRSPSWGIPVIYSRAADGHLFELPQPSGAAQAHPLSVPVSAIAQAPPRRPNWLLLIVGIIALVGAAIGIYSSLAARGSAASPPAAPPLATATPAVYMMGDINVAVATFGALDQQGRVITSTEASALADSLYTQLERDLQELSRSTGFDIQVLGPAQTRPITGTTGLAHTQSAAALAHAIGADIIIYGNLGADATSFAPEFYLAEKNLAGAEELSGQYEYGITITVPLPITTNAAARKMMREQLLSRVKPLPQFISGLASYSLANATLVDAQKLEFYQQAQQFFQAAADTPGTSDDSGKQVVLLFQGNVAGQMSNIAPADQRLALLEQAQQHYSAALDLKPGYARALMGVASVRFQMAKGDCQTKNVDAAGIREAIRGFEQARDTADSPAFANIPAKAAYSLSSAYLCLATTGYDSLEMAKTEASKVVAEYERADQHTKEQIRELAAGAHANLGLSALAARNAPPAVANQQRQHAADEYKQAIALSRSAHFQAQCYATLGFIYTRLNRSADSDAAYDQAIKLDPTNSKMYEDQRRARPGSSSSDHPASV